MFTWDDFEKMYMRACTIITATIFEGLRKPAFKLSIDFGALGIKKSSAQLTQLYTSDELIGKQIIAVVNFPPKQIANYFSECLVVGIYNQQHQVVLLKPDKEVSNGDKIG